MKNTDAQSMMADRAQGLERWLDDQAPYLRFDQRHLDAGSLEQAYWHLGYHAALRDALEFFRAESQCTLGTSNSSLSDEPGA